MVNVTIVDPLEDGGLDLHINNSEFNKWYQEENDRRENVKQVNKYLMNLLIAQMLVYLFAFLKHLDDRDDKIDDIIEFMDYIQDKKMGVDLEMSRLKAEVRNLAIPEPDLCGDPVLLADYSYADGEVVDALSEQLVSRTCQGLPDGWSLHEGNVMQARASVNIGGLIANRAVREKEWFTKQKTSLMNSAQRNMKAPYSASEILGMHAQSMNIYSGLADLYASGFNSAGAGIGTMIGRQISALGGTTTTPEATGIIATVNMNG